MNASLSVRLATPVVAVVALASLTPLAGSAAAAAPAAPPASGPDTRLVSVAAGGGPANGPADRPEISGNGRYVTFDSNATNLVAAIPTNERRIYRRDLTTGTTAVVSTSSTGRPAAEWSSFSWPSDDGNVIAFVSDDTTLATPAALNRAVYVRDMAAGRTELVSISTSGKAANGASSRPMTSPDGRYVVFSSFATNLSPSGGNGQEQVYLRDRVAGTTTLVSTAAAGGPGNNRSYRGMVSSDGRYVAYSSFATNLTAGTNPDAESIFLRDLVTGTTTRVTNRPNGQPAPLGGSRPYLSPDGRFIVFNTYDPIIASDTDTRSDVYVYDRTTGAMERQSVSASGVGGNSDSLRGFITDNGSGTVFNSFAGNLTNGDTNANGDVFARDRSTGAVKLLSVTWYGGGATGQSYRPVMSDDGSVVAYLSQARNLVHGDTSTDWQVYVVTAASVDATPDTTPATATISSPAAGATVPSPTTLAGTATDDRTVAAVYVQVRDNATGLWLRPDGTWGSGAARLPTTLSAPYARSTGWTTSLSLDPGSYGFEVVALDDAKNAPTKPWRSFTVGVADSAPPAVTVTSPTANQTVASPVTLGGRATDDLGVKSAFVQVRDSASGLWLRADGSWGTGAVRLPTTLGSPGATSTGWSTSLALTSGDYGFDVVALDAAGNASSRPWTTFRVGVPDAADPTVSVTSPQPNAVLSPPAVLRGTASDDVGVTRVFVQVRDNASMLWLRPDGTWGTTATRVPVALDQPGGTTTGWSVSPSLAAGSYGFDVVAVDAAGHQSTKPWTSFRVAAG